ncbi:hypothetical protein V6N11_004989 [Hibiscus sabdariffa]|uniref:Uncharacterized protein n=1 Tax=Hibiscus sabdariffa TaxID=183260 RepID=A0ABR2NHD6_9ROSI
MGYKISPMLFIIVLLLLLSFLLPSSARNTHSIIKKANVEIGRILIDVKPQPSPQHGGDAMAKVGFNLPPGLHYYAKPPEQISRLLIGDAAGLLYPEAYATTCKI